MITVVIVAYRPNKAILLCVESALKSKHVAEVRVVANSNVPHPLLVALRQRGATVIVLPSNLGFGGGCNRGVEGSAEKYILFLNPDVIISAATVDALLESSDGNSVVAPQIQLPNGIVERSVKSTFYVSSTVLLLRELLIGRVMSLGSPTPPTSTTAVDILSGACMLVPRRLHQIVGGFDEAFFLYGEDVDYCLRVRQAGGQCIYEPRAVVIHETGSGSGAASDPEILTIKGREIRRAHARLLYKHAGYSAAKNYMTCVSLILRLRRFAARALGDSAEVYRATAALDWLRSGALNARPNLRRVAVVTNGFHRTGAPLSLLAMLRMVPEDVQLHVAGIGGGPLRQRFARIAVTTELPQPSSYGLNLRRLLQEIQIGVALLRWSFSVRRASLVVNTVEYEAALLLAWIWPHPAMVIIRETPSFLKGFRGCLRRALLRSPRLHIVGVGRAQSAAWSLELGREVRHIPNVYDEVNPFPPQDDPPPKEIRFLLVANRSGNKGTSLVVDAFRLVSADLSASLLIAGADVAIDNKEAGITFLGDVPDLHHRIPAIADVLIGASKAETYSRSVVEAALMGVPTLAWRASGYIEQIEEFGGWFAKPFDVSDLALRMREIVSLGRPGIRAVGASVQAAAIRVHGSATAGSLWWQWIMGSDLPGPHHR